MFATVASIHILVTFLSFYFISTNREIAMVPVTLRRVWLVYLFHFFNYLSDIRFKVLLDKGVVDIVGISIHGSDSDMLV